MEEWELRLGLVEAEDVAGHQQERGFPGTMQTKAEKQKKQAPLLLGKPSV